MGHLTKIAQEVLEKHKDESKPVYKEEIYIDGIHEYNYIKDVDENKDISIHTLYYSDSSEWSESTKNTLALQLVDDGNGIIIEQLSTKKGINYLETEQLHIILRLHSQPSAYEISQPATKTSF